MDKSIITFWIVFSILSLIIIFLSVKYQLLKDDSILPPAEKPYSFAKTQMAWWTLIILSSFVTIIIANKKGDFSIPQFDSSAVILLGISAGTLASARLSDVSDKQNGNIPKPTNQDFKTESFLIDILSDKTGVSVHRLQTVVFNVVIGGWYISKVLYNLVIVPVPQYIMPVVDNNALILLGASSGAYVALKVTENKN